MVVGWLCDELSWYLPGGYHWWGAYRVHILLSYIVILRPGGGGDYRKEIRAWWKQSPACGEERVASMGCHHASCVTMSAFATIPLARKVAQRQLVGLVGVREHGCKSRLTTEREGLERCGESARPRS